MAAARTAPSAIPATGADMNTADATAKVAVTSNAVTWVSASAISFGDVAAAAGADSGYLTSNLLPSFTVYSPIE